MILSFAVLLAGPPGLVAEPMQPPARPLPLSAVRLTGGPLKHAQDLDAAYLLQLEPDRMLAHFLLNAGLPAKAEGYGGWDGGGKNLTGHLAGHYLSAVSLMWAATGDARFKERADYLVRELKRVQARQGDGYLGALAGGRERFAEVARGDIRSGGFDLNGLWSPWYVLHKIYAGLRDAWRFTGNREALELEVAFAAWAEGVLAGLDDAQVQRMLHTEFGGMSEVLADLALDTGDPRWLALSRRFDHRAVLDPLRRREDRLAGLHGNTQVPKLLGALSQYAAAGEASDRTAAEFFWAQVADHHSYATGGHGKDEYFGEPDRLRDRVDGRTAESCNVYNMLKLSRRLFALQPDARYADFHERALFNHVLASIDPQDGRTCYMVPVGRGVQREYQDLQHSFTCCVGSGLESHALHGDGLYYVDAARLWVNLYAPSTVEWKEAGLRLAVQTDQSEGESVRLALTLDAPRAFTLALRRPLWAGDGFAVTVNGAPATLPPAAARYVELARTWQSGDVVELVLPRTLRLEPVADDPQRAAILWGPLVLAGDLGPENEFAAWKPGAVPVLVGGDRPVSDWLKPAPGRPGVFRTAGVGRPREVEFLPFYRLHRRTYAVYWDILTPSGWERRAAELADEQARAGELARRTVAFVQPGEMQPERDFNQQGEDTSVDRVQGRPGRRGRKWFSFDLPVEDGTPLAVVVTYFTDEWRKRTFEVQVGGERVGQQVVEKGGPPRFFDVAYPLTPGQVAGRKRVTVRFEATQGNEIAGVYGVRMVRVAGPDPERR